MTSGDELEVEPLLEGFWLAEVLFEESRSTNSPARDRLAPELIEALARRTPRGDGQGPTRVRRTIEALRPRLSPSHLSTLPARARVWLASEASSPPPAEWLRGDPPRLGFRPDPGVREALRRLGDRAHRPMREEAADVGAFDD